MEYRVTINGLEVLAHYSEQSIEQVFYPILQYLTKLHRQKKQRILVLLAAPPGAGKSTMVDFLTRLSTMNNELERVCAIGMDGFHRYQEDLIQHTTIRDGREISLVQIKGHPMTFDLPRLTNYLCKTADGEDCWWPVYDRLKHNPQENAVFVQGNIIIVEGNYLLLEEEGWSKLRNFADVTIRIDAEAEMLRKRLIDRKTASGAQHAEEFVDFSDMVNVKLCLEHSMVPDILLRLRDDDQYEMVCKPIDL